MPLPTDAPPDRARYGIQTGSWPLGMPASGSFYRDLAKQVEGRGYDLLFSGDHMFMHNPNAEPLTLLGSWAGTSERLLLGTGVLLPALREPLLVAKQLATLDFLSQGRLIVGVGVGGEIEQEWRAMEIPREQRGARTEEALVLMRSFWNGEELDFQGRFRTVSGVTGSPPTHAPGGPPIWIGGRSDAALRRAARHDGWCAYSSSLGRIERSLAAIAERRPAGLADFRVSFVIFTLVADTRDEARALAGEVLGRRYKQDFDHFLDSLCAVGTAEEVAERFRLYREAGVQDFLAVPQVPWQRYPEQVDRLADAIGIGG